MKAKTAALTALSGLSVILLAIIIFGISDAGGLSLIAGETDSIGARNKPVKIGEMADSYNRALVEASNAVIPSVVSISVVVEEKGANDPFREEWREFFKFFGHPDQREQGPRKSAGSGSGVIISKDGYIVTNNHVVDNAIDIKVTTHERKSYRAELIGTDPLTDLAVIKIEADDLKPVHFSQISDVEVGETVIAVGNPLGLTSTVTKGIISAVGRGGLSLPNRSGYSVEHFIQTDAAINPGNSGGGLFDIEGSLVGINTAIASRTGSYIGYGFAIPIDLVRSVIKDLIEDGEIDRGYIGVVIKTVNEGIAKAAGLDEVAGVLVNDVNEDSPAEKAGLESGDIILAVDGKQVITSNELQSMMVLHRAGDKVSLKIWRDGKELAKSLTLEPKPDTGNDIAEDQDNGNKPKKKSDSDIIEFDKLGLKIGPLNEAVRKSHDLSSGALVLNVEQFSPAYDAGLVRGAVIIKANRTKIKSPGDLEDIIDSKSPGDAILLHVKYQDTKVIVALEIP